MAHVASTLFVSRHIFTFMASHLPLQGFSPLLLDLRFEEAILFIELLDRSARREFKWLIQVESVSKLFEKVRRCTDDTKLTVIVAQRQRYRIAAGDKRLILAVFFAKRRIAPISRDHIGTLRGVKELHVLRVWKVLDRLAQVVNAVERQLQRTTLRTNHHVVSHLRVAGKRFTDDPKNR